MKNIEKNLSLINKINSDNNATKFSKLIKLEHELDLLVEEDDINGNHKLKFTKSVLRRKSGGPTSAEFYLTHNLDSVNIINKIQNSFILIPIDYIVLTKFQKTDEMINIALSDIYNSSNTFNKTNFSNVNEAEEYLTNLKYNNQD